MNSKIDKRRLFLKLGAGATAGFFVSTLVGCTSENKPKSNISDDTCETTLNQSLPTDRWDNWFEMESKFAKPLIEKSIEMGNRAGWLIGSKSIGRLCSA